MENRKISLQPNSVLGKVMVGHPLLSWLESYLEQQSYFSTVTNGDLISLDATITVGFDLLAPLFEAEISGQFVLIDDYEVILRIRSYQI